MFLLKHVPPAEAEGQVEAIYNFFPPEIGPPQPLQMMSASPGFMGCQFEFIKYYSNHPTLSFPLLAAIRYMAARDCNYAFCTQFNQKLLSASGATENDLEAIQTDPDKAPLESNERAMLKFVTKVIKTPEAVEAKDVEALREIGWEDAAILDAAAHGAFMRGHGTLTEAFAKAG